MPTDYEMKLARGRVAKGLAALGDKAANIKTGTLSVKSYTYCPLSQAFRAAGGFTGGLTKLRGGKSAYTKRAQEWSEAHGFDRTPNVSYEALDIAWGEALAK